MNLPRLCNSFTASRASSIFQHRNFIFRSILKFDFSCNSNNVLIRRQRHLRYFSASPTKSPATKKKDEGSMHFVKAGLPLILFCGLGVWVVSNGIEGKNRERDTFQGRISKSERQALMEKEHDEMMEKMSAVYLKQDFDNTKRIERPDEVLARRRKEREERNRWYRRWWRAIRGVE
ncbi:hypothetical protein IV203_019238 [Nitzschia inconspicua]|uniref:Uncharacterized protein n=1 Tax=Nitzschia inconspicua TaxID=303405 RepID=A0A9K3LZ21_9STRA|nr:hypothetical protein IV203_019238 [Nitzschia inconspicua]